MIIALYSHVKEKAVERLRGMFSFVIWDKQEQSLYGARDHFGIKPFFYFEDEEKTFFASEKKSILLAMKNDVIKLSIIAALFNVSICSRARDHDGRNP